MQTVIYNGVNHNFPDEATPEMIKAALGIGATPAQTQQSGGVWDSIKNLVGPSLENLNIPGAVMGLGHAITSPIQTAKGIGSQMANQWGQAGQEYDNMKNAPMGSPAQILAAISMGGHGLASAIPVLGPAAAQAGQDIGNQQYSKGIGETAGLLTGVTGAMAPVARGFAKLTRLDELPAAVSNFAISPSEASQKAFPTTNFGDTAIKFGVATKKGASAASKGVESQLQNEVQNIPGTVYARELTLRAGDQAAKDGRFAGRGPFAQDSYDKLEKLQFDHMQQWAPSYDMNAADLLNEKRGLGDMNAWSKNRLGGTTESNVDGLYQQAGSGEARNMLDELAKDQGFDSTSKLLKDEQDLMGLQTVLGKSVAGWPMTFGQLAHKVIFNPSVMTGGSIAADRIGRAVLGSATGNRVTYGLNNIPGF